MRPDSITPSSPSTTDTMKPGGIIVIKPVGDLIAEARAQIKCLDAESAKTLYDASDNAIIIDVREAETAAELKLQDSINISRGLIEMQLPKRCSEPDTLILTHCGGGGRASLSALTLQQMGYTNVYAITASFEELKRIFG